MSRKYAAVAFVALSVFGGIGGRARAQFNFGDPFTPYNSQYNQFTYPMMPTDNAFPGSGYLDGHGSPRRSGSLDRFVEDLGNAGGMDGESTIRPKRTPHGMIRSRPSAGTASPEVQAEQKMRDARLKMNEDYNKALLERDPKKRKQMFQQLERERLNYLREMDEASKSVERPIRPLARNTTPPAASARPGAASARPPANPAARGGAGVGRNPAQSATGNAPRAAGTGASAVAGRAGTARPVPAASNARANTPAGTPATVRPAAPSGSSGRAVAPSPPSSSPFVNPPKPAGSSTTSSQPRDLMRSPGSVELDDRTRDLLTPPPLLRRPGIDPTPNESDSVSGSGRSAQSSGVVPPKTGNTGASKPQGASTKAKEKDTPARILEESKSLKP